MDAANEELRATFADRYRIVEEIGSGGMARVYLARDPRHERDVAIKVLRPELASAVESRRFLREIRVAAGLAHPHVVPVFDSGESDGRLWYVMPYLPDETLRDRLEEGPLPVTGALEIAEDVAAALDHAHSQGIAHRDVKPGNVFLSDGEAVVGDFGIALLLDDARPDDRLTGTGTFVGTRRYMSPEQVTGEGRIDWRSDVFSFGVMLYECVTGRLPFGSPDDGGYTYRLIAGDADDPGSSYPEGLRRFLLRCLQRESDERLDEPGTLAAEVGRIRRSATPASGAAPSSGRRPLALFAVAALLLVGAALLFRGSDPEGGAEQWITTQEAVVTWPGREREGRVLRDGRVSFLSDRGGGFDVWIAEPGGRAPRRITSADGDVLGHVWSPAGSRMAYVVHGPSGRFLRVSDRDGKKLDEFRLPRSRFNPRMAGWFGSEVFLLLDGGLRSVDVESGHRRVVPFGTDRPDGSDGPWLTYADVRPSDGRVVVVGRAGPGSDLWSLDPDGGEAVRLTNDTLVQASPCWLDDEVAHLSDLGGRYGVWTLDPETGRRRAVPGGVGAELVDCGADGDEIVVDRQEERADVWRRDPTTGEHAPLTSGIQPDLWPSVSANGAVAFQRARPRLEQGWNIFDGEIHRGRLENGRFASVDLVARGGFSPRISPDGRRIAFLARPSGADPRFAELRVVGGGMEQRLVTDRLAMPGFRVVPPLGLARDPVAWGPEGHVLYTAEEDREGRPVLRRIPLGDAGAGAGEGRSDRPPGETLVTLAVDETLGDMALDPTGRRLAFVVGSGDTPRRIGLVDLGADSVRTVHTETAGDALHIAGWLDGTGPLVALRTFSLLGRPDPVEPVLVHLDGRTEARPSLDGAMPGQAVLGSGGRLLVPVHTDEVDGVGVLDLASTGGWNWLTRGVSAGRPAEAPDGTLLYARHSVNSDVWRIRFADPSDALTGR